MEKTTRRRLLEITRDAMLAGTRFTVPDDSYQGEPLFFLMYWSHPSADGELVKTKARLEFTEEFIDEYEDATDGERQSMERRATQIITARCREHAARDQLQSSPEGTAVWQVRSVDC